MTIHKLNGERTIKGLLLFNVIPMLLCLIVMLSDELQRFGDADMSLRCGRADKKLYAGSFFLYKYLFLYQNKIIGRYITMRKATILSLALLFSVNAVPETQIVAHRGYWKTEGSAQNSIMSLKKADALGIYGSELDVWITRDGTVVVNHDPSFKGVTLETADIADVSALVLSNGEKMPTLEEYLQAAKKCNVKLVIEIKTHKDLWRQNLCIDKTLALVKKYKMQKRVDYIAFSYAATLRLIEKAPEGTEVYYLNGDKSPAELKQIGCAGPDYEQNVFIKQHPEWIPEFHRLGMKVNVWTVDNEENLKYFIDHKVDFITTNVPERLRDMLKK